MFRIGVARQSNETVQLWIAEAVLEEPILKTLVSTAEHVLDLSISSFFQVCIDAQQAIVLRVTEKFTFEALRVVLHLQGLPEGTYKLYWRRQELDATKGFLKDVGIGPGACLVLKRNGVVRI